MEFNVKLQELRKQKGLTQEELAKLLYVSRTAISKWESGKGYPNIESLKAIAKFFKITVDELLSGEELLTLAEEASKQKEKYFHDLVFGLIDISIALLFFLPFFREQTNDMIVSVPLLSLNEIAPYLKIGYFIAVIINIVYGILTLALQNCEKNFWTLSKSKLSLFFNLLCLFLFVISLQPYASVFLLILLTIKVLILIKW